MIKKILIIPLALILSCDCSPEKNPEKDVSELIAVDKEFSDYSVGHGRNSAFLKYAADEAVMLRPNGYPIEGINAIRDKIATSADTSFTLKWEPLKGFIAGSGELGYTYGIYNLSVGDTVLRGTYITIWKKIDGTWKFVFDAGNEGLSD